MRGFVRLLEFARRFVRDEIDAALHGAVVVLYLPVGLRMMGRNYDVTDAYQPQVLIELPEKIPGPVVGKQLCPILYRHVSHPCRFHRVLHHVDQ